MKHYFNLRFSLKKILSTPRIVSPGWLSWGLFLIIAMICIRWTYYSSCLRLFCFSIKVLNPVKSPRSWQMGQLVTQSEWVWIWFRLSRSLGNLCIEVWWNRGLQPSDLSSSGQSDFSVAQPAHSLRTYCCHSKTSKGHVLIMSLHCLTWLSMQCRNKFELLKLAHLSCFDLV